MRRLTPMLAAIFVSLLVPAASAQAPAPAPAPSWSTFADPDGAFTVDVPQPPTPSHTDEPQSDGSKIVTAKYMVDRGAVAMLVEVSHFEGVQLDPAAALDGAVKGTESEGRTLISDDQIVLAGHPGRSLVLRDGQGNTLTDKMFFFDNALFQAITVVGKDSPDDDRVMVVRFSGSFRFQQ